MAKKIKLTRKDSYLIVIGVLISFMIQSLTDALHLGDEILHVSLTVQFFSAILVATIFVMLTLLFLRNVEETS
jgi:hypothetical protein